MKISITPVLQAILDFFPDIISFQHVFHLGVGRSQIEWKLKVKTQISVFPWAKIGQNDHSNPYIESTTVLSDYRFKEQGVINPRRACAARVTVVVLCVCVSTTILALQAILYEAAYERYQQLQCYKGKKTS